MKFVIDIPNKLATHPHCFFGIRLHFQDSELVEWDGPSGMSLTELPKQEPCEDAISRQEVLEIIRDFEYKNSHEEMLINSRIKRLPSVTPAEKPSKYVAPDVLNHWIGAEVLDKIQTELYANAELHEDGDYYLREEWIGEIFDKYKPGNAINTHNKWD